MHQFHLQFQYQDLSHTRRQETLTSQCFQTKNALDINNKILKIK